jgi:hypothetical protein
MAVNRLRDIFLSVTDNHMTYCFDAWVNFLNVDQVGSLYVFFKRERHTGFTCFTIKIRDSKNVLI